MFDIVVPTYKIRPELIERCLDSIVAQDYDAYRVILVDGTPDDWDDYDEFRSVIDDHQLDLTYLRQTGKGVSQARNQAVSHGSNPFVAFLDGDDYWYPEHLGELAKSIKSTTDDHVIWWNPMDTQVVVVTPKNRFVSNRLCNYFANHGEWHNRYHGLWIATHAVFPSSVAVRKERFLQIGGFPEDLYAGEDTTCWILMLGDARYQNDIYLSYQNDYVGGFHDLQNEFGGDKGFFAKGQNPLTDLYGDDAANVFQTNLESRSKYWQMNRDDKPDDIDQETWDVMCSHKVYEGWNALL
tara:strand:- start:1419 stop:2306 length:888 start_codon:yes stop_codon:yes gene_type:complete